MTKKEDPRVGSFFTRRARLWDNLYDSPSPFWGRFNRLLRRGIFLRAELTLRVCKEANCRSVLDVGCGSGRVSALLAANGIEHVAGVDVATPMIELAKQLVQKRGVANACEFLVSDFLNFDSEDRYDAVIALGVFDYLVAPVAFLCKMRSLATKCVLFSVPSPTLVRMPLRKIRYTLRGCPVYFYRRSQLRQMLVNAGFQRFDIHRITLGGYGAVGWV